MPIERADPAIWAMAASTVSELRSFCFFSAISRTCASRQGAGDFVARLLGRGFEAERLLDEEGHRRQLHLEGEALVGDRR